MSALPQTSPISEEQLISFSNGISSISVNQQEIVKIFSQKSGLMMQGICRFESPFEILFPLFKGLSESGKPKSLNLRFSSEEKAAFFYYPEANHAAVSQFFSELVLLLQKEVKFKKVLKEVIINRNHFRSEQFLLQHAMMD
ncbi:hypothetical protein [Algoriphagus yeomjeoni]|uniref:Uncharacterized protein n=1 Tax=Algoriphagus yeomjeoni TaxID=291403 RepID=A0A327PQG3_9BACT|nr:hypothetical protein [Algoriphagus yeomjeoni]RAI93963.1 hypothetical protein LV83_00869 [Algoriphagus yeomjeoni]